MPYLHYHSCMAAVMTWMTIVMPYRMTVTCTLHIVRMYHTYVAVSAVMVGNGCTVIGPGPFWPALYKIPGYCVPVITLFYQVVPQYFFFMRRWLRHGNRAHKNYG